MFEALLARIATALDAAGVSYMVIGGQAVLFYGKPRLTEDVDITLGVGLERVTALLAICHAIGLRLLVENPEQFAQRTMVLPCKDTFSDTRVDFVLSNSAYEHAAIQRARSFRIEGVFLKVASPEDVVIHKIVAGRPRDMDDVRGILNRNPAVDVATIESTLSELSAAVGENLVSRFRETLRP